MMLLLFFVVLASANGRQFGFSLLPHLANQASETCRTPEGKSGECVLINHCPLLFTTFQNQNGSAAGDSIRQSHCGFEAVWFPKVCCPIENIPRRPTKCGLHTPGGEQDPWVALIGQQEDDGSRSFVCGGVLIHKRYVLTTAHCIKRMIRNSKLLYVRFGNYNAMPPFDVQVEEVLIHEDYRDQNNRNDIALIRLSKKVTLKNGEIKPICLPNGEITVEGNFQLAGWEKSGNETVNFEKKAGIATVWKRSECHSLYNNTDFTLGEAQICAEGKNKPYLHKHGINVGAILIDVDKHGSYSIVGISSLKPLCCQEEEHPQIYTKVTKYVNWIFNNIDI